MNNKDELVNEIETRLKTTMIGAIAQFEKHFGHLWENDHKNREYYEDLWENTRNIILNNGNHQIREATKSLVSYLYPPTFKHKYNYKFYFNKDKGDNYEN